MRKVSVPINITTITDENLPFYLESVKRCKVDRVFLTGVAFIHAGASIIYKEPERISYLLGEFKKVVKEVGFWLSSLGHGCALSGGAGENIDPRTYKPITGLNGEISDWGFCPTDKQFRKDFGDYLCDLAKFGPDIIMLDDDFRMHGRSLYMGCFCEEHKKEYFKRIGENVPLEKLEELMWTGGANKYRSEYMRLMGETLLDFAKELRSRIDEVNPNIRFGSSTPQEAWDANMFDVIDMQNAFKGKAAPFTRVCSAPYWDNNIIHQVETTRLEFSWLRNKGIEVMSEGDTYPRPRYNCPSKGLELFDMLLIANNTEDGLLNYVYEYNFGPEYEDGYVKRYVKNEKLRNEIAEIFGDKNPTGVEVFQSMHIVENFEFPKQLISGIQRKTAGLYQSRSSMLLSKNSIATCYENENSGYPLFLAGEHAKYVDLNRIKNGAILDYKAAKFLTDRGVDVGFLGATEISANGEFYVTQNGTIKGIGKGGSYALSHKETAEAISKYKPNGETSSYLYENANKQRFFVIGVDTFFNSLYKNYFHNYYRQEQIANAVYWICGKKLPAFVPKNPNLYILASKNEKAMAVALCNVFLDDIVEPVVYLDKEYSKIRFVNCNGELKGDKVYLSDISAYGIAAFEVE